MDNALREFNRVLNFVEEDYQESRQRPMSLAEEQAFRPLPAKARNVIKKHRLNS